MFGQLLVSPFAKPRKIGTVKDSWILDFKSRWLSSLRLFFFFCICLMPV